MICLCSKVVDRLILPVVRQRFPPERCGVVLLGAVWDFSQHTNEKPLKKGNWQQPHKLLRRFLAPFKGPTASPMTTKTKFPRIALTDSWGKCRWRGAAPMKLGTGTLDGCPGTTPNHVCLSSGDVYSTPHHLRLSLDLGEVLDRFISSLVLAMSVNRTRVTGFVARCANRYTTTTSPCQLLLTCIKHILQNTRAWELHGGVHVTW